MDRTSIIGKNRNGEIRIKKNDLLEYSREPTGRVLSPGLTILKLSIESPISPH